MKLFCLLVAIFSTLLYINLLIAEIVNAKINPYNRDENDYKREVKNSYIRIVLISIMSIFWSVFFILC